MSSRKHIPMCYIERTFSENSVLSTIGYSEPILNPRIRSLSVYVLSIRSTKASIIRLIGCTLLSAYSYAALVEVLYYLKDSSSSL